MADNSDIFRTQADTRFNSFTDPMNPVNMTPGQWGINAAYLTPSYTSPYRPKYQGPYGTQYGSQALPSFGSSLRNAAGLDFTPTNPAGNYYDQHQSMYSSLAYKPVDLGVSAAQNIAMPMGAAYLAYKYLNKPAEAAGRRFAESMAGGAARGFGMGTARAASIGMSAGRVGGFVGGMALPALAVDGALHAANSVFIDPFVNQRQTSDSFRRNFAGVTFGEQGFGNSVNGRGFSRSQGNDLGYHATRMGINDNTMSMNDVSGIMDMAGRAGLFDTAKASQFKKRAEDVLAQVKVLMQLGTSPDAKDAIETMSKLHQSGLSFGSQMTKFNTSMKGYATGAGVDTQRLMNTVGATGQYLFGANGLTPYLGQLAAGNAYSSFAAAARNGTLSPEMLARMGGVEGATQSSLTGQLNALKTPYAQMLGMNATFGKGISANSVSNVSAFGGMSAANPLQTVGAMGLYGNKMSSDLAAKGPDFIENMLYSEFGHVPGMKDKNGKITAEKAYAALAPSMGEEGARAFIAQLYARQGPQSKGQRLKGYAGARADMMLKFRQNNGLDLGGGMIEGAYHALNSGRIAIQEAGHTALAGANSFAASAGDSIEEMVTGLRMGDMTEKTFSKTSGGGYELGGSAGMSGLFNKSSRQVDKIRNLAKGGNASAQGFIDAMQKGSDEEMMKHLRALKNDVGINLTDHKEVGNIFTEAGKRTRGKKAGSNVSDEDVSLDIANRMTGLYSDLSEFGGAYTRNSVTGSGMIAMEGFVEDAMANNKQITAKEFNEKFGWNFQESDMDSVIEKIKANAVSNGTMMAAGSGKLKDLGFNLKGKSAKDIGALMRDETYGSETKVNYGDMSGKFDDLIMSMTQNSKDEASDRSHNSTIDWSSYSAMMKDSSNTFDQAVNNFANAVSAMTGKEVSAVTGGSSNVNRDGYIYAAYKSMTRK